MIFGRIFLLLKQKGINGTGTVLSKQSSDNYSLGMKLSSPVMLASLQITGASYKVLL